MQFVGDAVMAVFGAPFPQPDHADRALEAALAMHRSQHELNQAWEGTSREEFLLGIGLSTGEAAAALLGSEERLEYTLVGRHREPGPAAAGDGPPRRADHPQRGHLGRASPSARRPPPTRPSS